MKPSSQRGTKDFELLVVAGNTQLNLSAEPVETLSPAHLCNTNNDRENAQIFCSIGLTASLFFHDVLTCFSVAMTSQNARNKGRYPQYIVQLRVKHEMRCFAGHKIGGSVSSI
jgi:hypothetical protein